MKHAWMRGYHWLWVVRSTYSHALFHCLSLNMVGDDAVCNPSIHLLWKVESLRYQPLPRYRNKIQIGLRMYTFTPMHFLSEKLQNLTSSKWILITPEAFVSFCLKASVNERIITQHWMKSSSLIVLTEPRSNFCTIIEQKAGELRTAKNKSNKFWKSHTLSLFAILQINKVNPTLLSFKDSGHLNGNCQRPIFSLP